MILGYHFYWNGWACQLSQSFVIISSNSFSHPDTPHGQTSEIFFAYSHSFLLSLIFLSGLFHTSYGIAHPVVYSSFSPGMCTFVRTQVSLSCCIAIHTYMMLIIWSAFAEKVGPFVTEWSFALKCILFVYAYVHHLTQTNLSLTYHLSTCLHSAPLTYASFKLEITPTHLHHLISSSVSPTGIALNFLFWEKTCFHPSFIP